MSHIDHILLYLLLYSSLIFADFSSRQKSQKRYLYFIYLIPIVLYIIVEGSRYGRGVDYFGYGPNYKYGIKTEQPVFDLLNDFIRIFDLSTSLPYGICFHVYAAIFIFGLFKLYTEYKSNSKNFLLFGCFATLYITEWTIRQGVSLSFFLPAIFFLDKKEYKWCLFFTLLAVLTHYGNIISIIILFLSYIFLNNKPLPIKITIPLYIFFTLFFEKLLPFISDKIALLNLSSLGGNFQGYIDNASTSFGTDAVQKEWQRGTLQQILTTTFYCGLLIVGYYHHKINNLKVYIYNAFTFGILIVEPFHLIGNLTRPFLLLSVLWFIPLSLSLYYWLKIKNITLVRVSVFFIWIYLLSYFGRYIFLNPSATYVWNV